MQNCNCMHVKFLMIRIMNIIKLIYNLLKIASIYA